jgi:predicted phosphodiesterase
LYYQTFQPYACDIFINCDNLKRPQIKSLLKNAKNLCLVKSYLFSKKETDELAFRITLDNIREFSQDFINFIEKEQKELQSSTNKNFLLNISFNIGKATQREIYTDNSYIRVISDIHADYNKKYNYKFDFGEDYVINCGDTAGDSITAKAWCDKNMRKGVVVMGNHLGYSPAHPELETLWMQRKNKTLYGSPHHVDNTKNSQMLILSRSYTGYQGRLRFISNGEHKLDDIVILGTCLYSDFRLYGDEHVEESMHYARQNMNDFKLIHVVGHREYKWTPEGWKVKMIKREKSALRLFTPEDHAYFFHFSFNYLKSKVEEYKNKKIIIATHFAPSPYSISPQYAGSLLNPAFASNLNDFIVSNPQIRLWCHGHVHTPCDYILGETRIVCNPFGYNNENNVQLPYKYGTRIAIKDIQSDKSWTKICEEEIEEGKIKVYKN